MKAAVIADIHDNLANLEKCLAWIRDNGLGVIFCAGDITNSETLGILNNFSGDVYLIRGNMDLYEDKDLLGLKNIKYYGRFGLFDFNGKKIGLCHEPYFIEKILEKGRPDIIFYGHTHRPWETEEDGVRAINPGTLGAVFQKATFAVYNSSSGEAELKILETV